MNEEAYRRANLVLRLRSLGITDHAILSAFEATPRHAFAPRTYAADAYADRLIPIACGQTMEAPTTLATLLMAARLGKDASVLDIGAGSGYLTALLARLTRRVIALERWRTLAEGARANIKAHGVTNAEVILTDGTAGWPPAGPYRAIFVTASVERPMALWFDQLEHGGRLIAPVGPPGATQRWMCFTNDPSGETPTRPLGPTFAAPLTPGLARSL